MTKKEVLQLSTDRMHSLHAIIKAVEEVQEDEKHFEKRTKEDMKWITVFLQEIAEYTKIKVDSDYTGWVKVYFEERDTYSFAINDFTKNEEKKLIQLLRKDVKNDLWRKRMRKAATDIVAAFKNDEEEENEVIA